MRGIPDDAVQPQAAAIAEQLTRLAGSDALIRTQRRELPPGAARLIGGGWSAWRDAAAPGRAGKLAMCVIFVTDGDLWQWAEARSCGRRDPE